MQASSSESLKTIYSERFGVNEAYRKRVWAVLCSDFFGRLIASDARVLDLGCGWGEFINQIPAAERYAMDLNPDAKLHLEDPVKFLYQDCSAAWPLQDSSLDVVFSSNFLEHLASKEMIECTLKEAYRTLRPGGKLILMGPNIRYVPGSYWDFWDHHVPLTDLSVAELLTQLGFKVVQRWGRFLPYTMSGGGQPHPFLISLYLRMPIVWRLLGKQFLVVGQK